MTALDKVFLKDETRQASCAFGGFVVYNWRNGENCTVFILEYEKRYGRICFRENPSN